MRVTYGRNRQRLGFWWMALVPLVTDAMKPKEGPYVPPPPAAPKVSPLAWAGFGLGAVVLLGGLALVLKGPGDSR